MNLTQVAAKAAADVSAVIDPPLNETEMQKVTEIIQGAMKNAVLEASSLHSNVCTNSLSHDQDLAHKIQTEIERKKVGLIANLSSLR
ncbi:MAG: hypothetical protein OD817_05550 [Gammaproteobacteria bacterium]